MEVVDDNIENKLTLVARKGCFGLPTACPSCLPVYLYLKFANASFKLDFDMTNPDSGHIPYIEFGDCVAYDNEKGGVIQSLKEHEIVDLDSNLTTQTIPELSSLVAMIDSWLVDAVHYELWVASDECAADSIYFSDLSWPIRKALHWKRTLEVKTALGITKSSVANREEEIQRKAVNAYAALSFRLGEQQFFFCNRPTSLDALCGGHILFVLHVLPDTSPLRSSLLKHDNLVKYAEHLKMEFLEASATSSSVPRSPNASASSTMPRRGASSKWSSKPKEEAKRERNPKEEKFSKHAKFFLAAQCISILVFLSLMGGGADDDAELDDGDDYE